MRLRAMGGCRCVQQCANTQACTPTTRREGERLELLEAITHPGAFACSMSEHARARGYTGVHAIVCAYARSSMNACARMACAAWVVSMQLRWVLWREVGCGPPSRPCAQQLFLSGGASISSPLNRCRMPFQLPSLS